MSAIISGKSHQQKGYVEMPTAFLHFKSPFRRLIIDLEPESFFPQLSTSYITLWMINEHYLITLLRAPKADVSTHVFKILVLILSPPLRLFVENPQQNKHTKVLKAFYTKKNARKNGKTPIPGDSERSRSSKSAKGARQDRHFRQLPNLRAHQDRRLGRFFSKGDLASQAKKVAVLGAPGARGRGCWVSSDRWRRRPRRGPGRKAE